LIRIVRCFAQQLRVAVRNEQAGRLLSLRTGAALMRRIKPQPIRNRLDLADVRQVRSMKKRLRLSEGELNEIVGKIGNSIAAISKEVALKKARRLPAVPAVPNTAVIAAVRDPAAVAAEPAIAPHDSEPDGTLV
jgi:hypothetical protein